MSVGRELENGILFVVPARPLPQEMLVEIFLHCVEYDELSERLPGLTSPPLTLTWVCRYWRSLAITMQDLWTSISLGVMGSDPADDVHLLDLWIERAGATKKLDINICHEMKDAEHPVFFDPNRGERYLVGMKVLTDKLLSISCRWRTLDLHALDLYVLDPILRALVTIGMPNLESLSISTKYFDFFGSVHFLDLSSCREMRSLRILCPMLCPTATSKTSINMTNLEIRYCPYTRDCLTWLSICPNLERLNVRFFRSTPSNLSRDEIPLSLPRLTHLAVSYVSDDSDPSPLLDLLTLPALRDLSLDINGLVYPQLSRAWSEKIHNIIVRSRAPLERFALLGTPMIPDVLLQLLESTPRIKELVLSGLAITDKFLESLAINMKTPTLDEPMAKSRLEGSMTFSLCPRLESLELRNFECSLNALISFIYARCRPRENSGPLKNLTLIYSPHPALLDHPLVRECIAGGLEIMNRAYDTGKLVHKTQGVSETFVNEVE